MDPKCIKDVKWNTFNETMREFITELKKIFPQNINLKAYNSYFILTLKENEELPVKKFYKMSKEYENLILQKDISALLETDNTITKILGKNFIKENKVSQQNIDIIMQYIQNLYILSCALCSKRYSKYKDSYENINLNDMENNNNSYELFKSFQKK